MTSISEGELLLPSLYLMMVNGGSIDTSTLRNGLRDIMKPSGEDEQILSGRSDTHFDQKVRNLKAHNTFDRLGYASYDKGRQEFVLTKEGEEYIKNNHDIIKYLLTNGFGYEDLTYNFRELIDRDSEVQTFDENITVNEGFKRTAYWAVYNRSRRLRDYAFEYYSDENDRINCHVCGFNFDDFYGEDLSKSFIEMHHNKPIFKYEDQDLEQYIGEAIKNITPVCSNCHRMIHRDRHDPMEVEELKEAVRQHGTFTS
jgi:hypothetical protein